MNFFENLKLTNDEKAKFAESVSNEMTVAAAIKSNLDRSELKRMILFEAVGRKREGILRRLYGRYNAITRDAELTEILDLCGKDLQRSGERTLVSVADEFDPATVSFECLDCGYAGLVQAGSESNCPGCES